MKRIIHMSDLHIGFEDYTDRLKKVIENLKQHVGDEVFNYVIVITGDLVDNANHEESFHLVKRGLNDLRQAGFEHILVVPGNHDCGTGQYGDKKYLKSFQEIFYADKEGFPRNDIIDGIAFIGLNSMAEELHWHDRICAEGEIGAEQLLRLEDLLKSDDIKSCRKRVIYLHHHPMDFRPLHQLKDSRKLKKLLIQAMADGITIDAILYGHNHEGKTHNGHWGIARCYDAGSVTLKARPNYVDWLPWFKSRSATRIVDIHRSDVQSDHELALL